MQAVTTIGLDIAKSVFQVHGVDAAGNVIVRRQLKRRYAVPTFRALPGSYGWLMRRKIARLYGELRFLEDEITGGGPTDRAQLTARLDGLEKQANQLRMPIVYESMMYLLRHHISIVRNRLATY
jgi:hypothetical protein